MGSDFCCYFDDNSYKINLVWIPTGHPIPHSIEPYDVYAHRGVISLLLHTTTLMGMRNVEVVNILPANLILEIAGKSRVPDCYGSIKPIRCFLTISWRFTYNFSKFVGGDLIKNKTKAMITRECGTS